VRVASAEAIRTRSVNTVTFAPGGARGDTTDGAGFMDLLAVEGREVASARVTLLGAGGSARSLALAIGGAGGKAVRVVSRREPEAGEAWGGPLGERWAAWGSSAAERAFATTDVLVNCTPLGAGELPSPFQRLPRGALIVDLTYGPAVTPWVAAARSAGLDAVDGLSLLVHQARRSLAIWLGHDVPDIPLEPLLAAVRRTP